MNYLQVYPKFSFAAWTLFKWEHLGRYEKPIAIISEYLWFNLKVGDNLTRNSAAHFSVTISVIVLPEDSLSLGQRLTNTLYNSTLWNDQIRKYSKIIRNNSFNFSKILIVCFPMFAFVPNNFYRNKITSLVPFLLFFLQ